jgi:putative transposase
MARRPRIFGEELYHHIYAWGNNGQAIFITDNHYQRYLNLLEKCSEKHKIDIIAYALMQTHIHLFVCDHLAKISLFMNELHGEYAQYFNYDTGRIGHVFGERFNNKIVQANTYGLWLSRYIHRQAVEAGIAVAPEEYPWTSYNTYLAKAATDFLKPDVILDQFGTGRERFGNYENFVIGPDHNAVDWDAKSFVVAGDEKFQHEVRQRQALSAQENLSDDQIFHLILEHFQVGPELLSDPKGLHEKRLRHTIIHYLSKELGLRPKELAELCTISRSAVHKILNTKV